MAYGTYGGYGAPMGPAYGEDIDSTPRETAARSSYGTCVPSFGGGSPMPYASTSYGYGGSYNSCCCGGLFGRGGFLGTGLFR